MQKNYQKFGHFEPVEPPAGLFDKIIAAIRREQELQHSKRLLFGFLILLIISFIAIPLSWTMFVNQLHNSGISYFISAALSTALDDARIFFALWQDFALAILESLPITGIIAFGISIGTALFTLRLFLYKKRLLLGYLIRS